MGRVFKTKEVCYCNFKVICGGIRKLERTEIQKNHRWLKTKSGVQPSVLARGLTELFYVFFFFLIFMLGNVPPRIFFEVFIMVGESDLHCCNHLGFRTNFSSSVCS